MQMSRFFKTETAATARIFGTRCVLFLVALMVIGCNRSTDFPPLKNGETLRADCARLIAAYPEGEISSNGWPRSVKALKPIRVLRETNAVRIFVEAPKGFRGGYWVSPNTQSAPSVRNTWIQKTEFKGIYQFRTY